MNLSKTAFALSLVAASLAACSDNGGDVMGADAAPDRATLNDIATPDATPDQPATPDATPDVPVAPDAAADAASDASADAPADVAMVTCPADPPVEMHATDVTADATWDCTRTHVLANTSIFVRNNATLRITPGTVIKGGGERAALVVTTSGRIDAQGTRAQPIVFTSNQPAGMRRAAQWGGVVLLGLARINNANSDGDGGVTMTPGTGQIEGIDPTEGRARFGGSDDAHNCGTLRYVRIEFPGYELSTNNELNGLTMGGCGRGTVIDYVSVHKSADDGIEVFGGTVDLKHVFINEAEDDGLDWDNGWTGRAQFVAVRSPTTSTEADPNGFEADNEPRVFAATPVADPQIFNATFRGPGSDNMVTVGYRGGVLRRGTAGRLNNLVMVGYPTQAIDVRDTPTIAFANATPARLFANNSIFFGNNPTGTQFADNGMDMFDEDAFFTNAARMNRAVDPMLPAYTTGSLVPAAGSPAATGAATPPTDGFFEAVTYVGAFPPGAADHWASGWTAFPAN